MKYRIYLDAIQCNRLYSNFIKSCDLGIEEIGAPKIISFVINQAPTEEIINKIIECHLKSKDELSLSNYFTSVKLNRIEVIL